MTINDELSEIRKASAKCLCKAKARDVIAGTGSTKVFISVRLAHCLPEIFNVGLKVRRSKMVKLAFLILSSWFVFNTCIDLMQGYALLEQQGKTLARKTVNRRN